jgi:hypothetical protein
MLQCLAACSGLIPRILKPYKTISPGLGLIGASPPATRASAKWRYSIARPSHPTSRRTPVCRLVEYERRLASMSNGCFEFARNARDASGAVIALVFLAPDDLGNAFDLAAWEPETGRLALWLGRVSMLGQDNLYGWRLGDPLMVHETPLEWLQAGRGGVFVIDHQRASPLLRMVEPLGVKRPEFGRQLQAALTIRAPRIVVAARPAVAA